MSLRSLLIGVCVCAFSACGAPQAETPSEALSSSTPPAIPEGAETVIFERPSGETLVSDGAASTEASPATSEPVY